MKEEGDGQLYSSWLIKWLNCSCRDGEGQMLETACYLSKLWSRKERTLGVYALCLVILCTRNHICAHETGSCCNKGWGQLS